MAKKEKVTEEVTSEATPETSTEETTPKGDLKESKELTVKQLEEEGDIAADYLEELLDITDLDGDIDIDVREGRAYLAVSASKESNLALISHPDTVEALQELTRLAVQVKTNSFSRLILDVGGSRQAKIDQLTRIVSKVIDKAKDTGEAQHLKPMSSYERKLAHDLIAEAGLSSESEGEGRDRHIVIRLAD